MFFAPVFFSKWSLKLPILRYSGAISSDSFPRNDAFWVGIRGNALESSLTYPMHQSSWLLVISHVGIRVTAFGDFFFSYAGSLQTNRTQAAVLLFAGTIRQDVFMGHIIQLLNSIQTTSVRANPLTQHLIERVHLLHFLSTIRRCGRGIICSRWSDRVAQNASVLRFVNRDHSRTLSH